jgi:3-phosphoinositide dependent protein kinase-1
MEGDLSLSQALGGLRIANQTDDSPPLSPQVPSSHSSHSNGSAPHSQIYIPDLQSLESTASLSLNRSSAPSRDGAPAASLSSQSLPLHSTNSHSPTTPSQSQGSFPPQPRSTYPPQAQIPSRHSSQLISNYGAASAPGNASAYSRISREPSRSSLAGPPSTRLSQRGRSDSDRYRQPQATGPSPLHDGGGVAGESVQGPYNPETGIPPSSADWQEKGAAISVRKEVDANGNVVVRVVKKGVKDFNFGRTLGEGSYSSVGPSSMCTFAPIAADSIFRFWQQRTGRP